MLTYWHRALDGLRAWRYKSALSFTREIETAAENVKENDFNDGFKGAQEIIRRISMQQAASNAAWETEYSVSDDIRIRALHPYGCSARRKKEIIDWHEANPSHGIIMAEHQGDLIFWLRAYMPHIAKEFQEKPRSYICGRLNEMTGLTKDHHQDYDQVFLDALKLIHANSIDKLVQKKE